MKKRNIFQQQSQELMCIYEEAGNSKKVMVVPMDYAKKEHTVMFCNGNGDILRKPFGVWNTPEGVDYLVEQIHKTCTYHKINKKHVVLGGEDCGSYTENFAHSLREHGWLVAGINAHDAKKQRENMQASTDRLDLLGIAMMLINRRGNCSPCQSGGPVVMGFSSNDYSHEMVNHCHPSGNSDRLANSSLVNDGRSFSLPGFRDFLLLLPADSQSLTACCQSASCC
jgi:hypothetical protein